MKLFFLSAAAALVFSAAHAHEYNVRGSSSDVSKANTIVCYRCRSLLSSLHTSYALTNIFSLLTSFHTSSHFRLTSINWTPMKHKICSCLSSLKTLTLKTLTLKTLTLKTTMMKSLMMKNTNSSKFRVAGAVGEGIVVVMRLVTIVAVV